MKHFSIVLLMCAAAFSASVHQTPLRPNRRSRRTVPGARRSPPRCWSRGPCASATWRSTATRCIGSKAGPKSKAIRDRPPHAGRQDRRRAARAVQCPHDRPRIRRRRACAAGGTVYFTNYADQRLWQIKPGEAPQPITAESKLRFADFVLDAPRNRLIAVCEDHSAERPRAGESNRRGRSGRRQSHDARRRRGLLFQPRVSPDGRQLAWLAWNHPEHALGRHRAVRRADRRRRLARQAAKSRRRHRRIDLSTKLVARRHALFRFRPQRIGGICTPSAMAKIEPVLPMDAEFGAPQWVFGTTTYGFQPDGSIIARYTRGGKWNVMRIDPQSGKHEPIELPYSNISSIDVAGQSCASPSPVRRRSRNR